MWNPDDLARVAQRARVPPVPGDLVVLEPGTVPGPAFAALREDPHNVASAPRPKSSPPRGEKSALPRDAFGGHWAIFANKRPGALESFENRGACKTPGPPANVVWPIILGRPSSLPRRIGPERSSLPITASSAGGQPRQNPGEPPYPRAFNRPG